VSDEARVPEERWNPRAALESLVFETQMDGGDAGAATSRILREHAVLAAQSIAHLAAYAQTERIRLQASQYIVDRVLGSGLDLDIRLQQEQTRQVGQALYSAVRALGLRYGFDPDDPHVRALAHDTLIELTAGPYDQETGQ
jgi:hypothetical protein